MFKWIFRSLTTALKALFFRTGMEARFNEHPIQAPSFRAGSLTFSFLVLTIFINEAKANPLVEFIEQVKNIDKQNMNSVLEKADMIIIKKGDRDIPYLVVATTLIDAEPEKVWKTVTDFEHYNEFMTNVAGVDILKREGNIEEAEHKIKFKFSILSMQADIVYRHVYKAPYQLDATSIAGDFDRSEFHWRLISTNDGKKTIALYSNYGNLKSFSKIAKWVVENQPPAEIGFLTSVPILALKSVKNRIQPKSTGIPYKNSIELLNQVKNIDMNILKSIFEVGDVILFDPYIKIPQTAIGGTIFDASINRVWDVVINRDYLPNTKGKVVEKTDDYRIIDLEVEFKFSIFSMSVNYTLREILKEPYQIDGSFVKGDLDDAETHWRSFPIDDGVKTLTLYSTYTNYKSLSWLANWVFKQQPDLELALAASVPIITLDSAKDYIKSTEK